MNKKIFILLVICLFALPLSSSLATDVFRSKTEMIQWESDKAYNGYNTIITGGTAYLVDMEGQVINAWEGEDTGPGGYFYLMENGRWRTNPSPFYAPKGILQEGGARGRPEEYTWEGDRVWWWDCFDGEPDPSNLGGPYINATFRAHHDWQTMWNKDLRAWTYLVLIWIAKDQTDAINLGTDPAFLNASNDGWSPCALIELLPDYTGGYGGDIVWHWCFADHMVTTDPGGTASSVEWLDETGRINMPPAIGNPSDYPEKLNVNGIHYTEFGGPRPDYQHCNSFDYDANTGHIAINAKACNEFFVFDHDGTFDPNATRNDWNSVGALARTSAGDFLYRFGMPANYASNKEWPGWYNENDAEMYGTHDLQFIRNYHWRADPSGQNLWPAPDESVALPGAGNFLMFDNGCYNPLLGGSFILEVDPYEDGGDSSLADPVTGYVDPAKLPRRAQVVWSFGNNIYDFYSHYISGCTRMPNGNTVIDAGSEGHLFEVTTGGDVVWEYIVPGVLNGKFCTTCDDSTSSYCRTVSQFRFYRFGPNHPGLAGKDLSPQGTLTGRIPLGLESDVYPESVTYTGFGFGSGITTGEAGAEAGEGDGGDGY
jgi:hypothetical protein